MSFFSEHLKVSVLGPIHSKNVDFLWKIFERLRVCTQNSWKVFVLDLKHLKRLVSNSPKYSRLRFISDCVILVQKTREILNFYAKHSIKVVFCKEKILGTSDSQNIQKVHYFNTKDSICITFVHKTFEKFVISGQNIQKVLNFYAKQSNEFILVIQLLEKYLFLILSQNIWKVFDFGTKHSRSIWFCFTTFKKYCLRTQNIRKVFDFFPKHSIHIDFAIFSIRTFQKITL